MVENDEMRLFTSMVFFNPKGYVTEEDLKNEIPNWQDIIDEIEPLISPMGMRIKHFFFMDQNCYAVNGPEEFGMKISDKESYVLIDFVSRFEILKSNPIGLALTKWKDLLSPKIGGSRSTMNTIKKLKNLGFLEQSNDFIRPGWRYYAFLNIGELIKEIQNDANLAYLTKDENKEAKIFD